MLTTEEIKVKIKFYTDRANESPSRTEREIASSIAFTYEDVLYSYGHDAIVVQLIDKIIMRSRAGMEEYGSTLDANALPPAEWLNHLQEELLDASLYIEKMKTIKS